MKQNGNFELVKMNNIRTNKIMLVLIGIITIISIILCGCSCNKKEPVNNITYDEYGDFLLPIEDAFTISGNENVIVTGEIIRGKIKLGDNVQIIGLNKEIITTQVIGIEMLRQKYEEAKIGHNVGITLKDVTLDEIQRGQVLAKPNSIEAITRFEAEIEMYSVENGGRENPIYDQYKPVLSVLRAKIPAIIELIDGIEMIKPGDKATVIVTLSSSVALEPGMKFTINDPFSSNVGEGIVTKLY